MASILRVAVGGKTKTCIMRKCNLSFRQLQAYLAFLKEKGLLKVELHKGKSEPERVYVTTERGLAFLKAYGNLKATLRKNETKIGYKV
jgi:predicted transcriptional regulator